eukprot:scaffold109758_cov59-Phaeocystis_antarctica.AAC.2
MGEGLEMHVRVGADHSRLEGAPGLPKERGCTLQPVCDPGQVGARRGQRPGAHLAVEHEGDAHRAVRLRHTRQSVYRVEYSTPVCARLSQQCVHMLCLYPLEHPGLGLG